MPTIRIAANGPGKQPECERKKLIGLILSVAEDAPKKKFETGYPVNTEKVIEALEINNWQTAQWWREHINPETTRWILFNKEACQLV